MNSCKKWISLVLAFILCSGLLAGCTGNAETTEPVAAEIEESEDAAPTAEAEGGGTFAEAPYITALGSYGEVTDRLPVEEDIMVEAADYLTVGVYGGELKTSASTSAWTAGKIIEEGLFRFDATGAVEPNVAKGYDVNEDATVYTIYLREGMKWSDGEPFTAEDCVWFYNVICANTLDSKGIRNCHLDSDGNPAVVEKVDEYTFTVTFGASKYDFIETVCVDLKWHWAPKHIFEDMVNAMVAGNDEEALAEAEEICGIEFADAATAGKSLLYNFWNYAGVPTLNPYVLSTEDGKNDVAGDYYEYVRNPYYWKTDVSGQQLPYIDKITYTAIQNEDQSLLLLLDGTVDFQVVGMDALATIQSDAAVGINIYEWSGSSWGSVQYQVHFNLSIDDSQLNALFNNADFRQAMSICVDREEFAAIVSDGWLEGGQAAPQEGALGYSEEWASKWTEYDVEKAKSLLESAGLAMGSDGYYDFADGTDFALNIVSVADTGTADTYALLKPFYDEAGIKTTFRDYDRANVDNMILANEIECILYPVTGLGDVSIALKPNSMVPGTATNVVWYGDMTKETASGDLLKLIELKEELDRTVDQEERTAICLEMLKLHEENMWSIGYVAADTTYHAVNARIQNFLEDGVWSDIYRDLGLAHVQCWYIPADQQ